MIEHLIKNFLAGHTKRLCRPWLTTPVLKHGKLESFNCVKSTTKTTVSKPLKEHKQLLKDQTKILDIQKNTDVTADSKRDPRIHHLTTLSGF